ncbi:MAG: energy transducer TonB [Chthoniobacter sp.]|nr:energy transducer TonB [Chthoniobacter sp.]
MKTSGAIPVSLVLHGLALAAAIQWQSTRPPPPAAGAGEPVAAFSFVPRNRTPDAAPPTPTLDVPEFVPPAPDPPVIATTQITAPPTPSAPAPVAPRLVAKETARASGARQTTRGAGGGGSGRLIGKSEAFRPPLYHRCPAPAYPAAARAKKIAGVVLLRVAVSESGAVENVSLRRSSGSAALDEAALQVVRGWSFQPAQLGGRAVAASVEVPVRFALTS